MNNVIHSLIWAAVILVAASISSAYGLSDAAGHAITMGLVGAAVATLKTDSGCGTSCLS